MLGRSDPRTVVEAFNRAWADNDLDAAMAFVADDATFVIHIDQPAIEHAGRWTGRDQIRRSLAISRSNFDYILYRPIILGVSGEIVRVRIEYIGTHKASGERLSMRFRNVMTVREGLIAHCDEYHDAAMLQAFMQLVCSPQY